MLFHCTSHLVKLLKKLVVDISRRNLYFVDNFNAKPSNWSSNDTTTAEEAQLDYLTFSYGMKL